MNIGKLSVVLSASSAPFLKALDETKKYAGGWAKSVGKTVASAGGSALGLLGKGAGLAGAFGVPLSAAGAAAGAKSGMDDLVKVDQQARLAGVSIGEFRGAMLAAGPAAGAMESALTSLSTQLGSLQAGVISPATQALQGLGLDGSADMEQLARAISSQGNPLQQAAKAYEVLGDSAKGVLHLLTDGGAQLAAGKGLAERFGLGADSKSIAAIREAQQTVSAFSQGITNQLALGAAPIVQELSQHFNDLAGFVKSGAKAIAYGGAVVVEAWKGVTLIWDGLKIGFKSAVGYILQGLAWLGEQVNWLSEQFENLTGVAMGRFDLDGLKASAANFFDSAGKDADAFWGKWANDKSAFAKVDGFFAAVEQRGAQAGQALAKAPFVDAFARRFVELKNELAQANPLAQWKKSTSEIQAFADQGLFKGQEQLQALMTQKAFANLQSMVKLPELRQPDAALAGSREAYSAVVTHQRGDRRLTVQEQMKALLAEGKKLQEEQVRIGKEANETLKEIAAKEAEVFDF